MRRSWLGLAGAAMMISLGQSAIAQAENTATGLPADTPAPADDTAARIAAVQRHVDAYRSGDIDRFVATFTPDAQVFAMGLSATGHKKIRSLYRLNFGPSAPAIRIVSSDANEHFVFLEAAYVMKNGEEICCSFSEYEVRDGKISYLSSSAP